MLEAIFLVKSRINTVLASRFGKVILSISMLSIIRLLTSNKFRPVKLPSVNVAIPSVSNFTLDIVVYAD